MRRMLTLIAVTGLKTCLLLAYASGVWYLVTHLPGSRLDRRDQWQSERELLHWAEACPSTTAAHDAREFVSMCSAETDSLGPNQRVVSFSFFGDYKPWRKFLQGIHHNAELVKQYYPGWRMRVYHSIARGSRWWTPLLGASCRHEHVDLCSVPDLPGGYDGVALPMLWRALPARDPLVDIFVSRDLDSRVSPREAAAVAEWLASNMTFHVMRDYPGHKKLIMGGMWGARVQAARLELLRAIDAAHETSWPAALGKDDQDVLTASVWPLVSGRVMQHDAYSCDSPEVVASGGVRPFPTRRSSWSYSNFVGALFNDWPLTARCPIECRPSGHPEWIHC